jgi:hypothetical protein
MVRFLTSEEKFRQVRALTEVNYPLSKAKNIFQPFNIMYAVNLTIHIECSEHQLNITQDKNQEPPVGEQYVPPSAKRADLSDTEEIGDEDEQISSQSSQPSSIYTPDLMADHSSEPPSTPPESIRGPIPCEPLSPLYLALGLMFENLARREKTMYVVSNPRRE